MYDIENACVGKICVGFNIGDSSKGFNFVGSPANTRVNSDESLIAAKRCEEIVNNSGLEPFSKAKIEGFWRIFLYRESSVTNQALVSFVVTESSVSMSDEIKREILDAFSKPINNRKIVSITVIYASEISGGYKETDRVE